MQFGEHVAVQSGDDILLFVVQRPGVQSENDAGDLEDPAMFDEPQQRPGPTEASFVVYRWGDCKMEADIPANPKSCLARFLVLFTVIWYAIIALFLVIVCAMALVRQDAGLCLLLLCPILHIPGFIPMIFKTMRLAFTHENLTITPTSFNIKRTIEFRSTYRDSVNNADTTEAERPRLDRVFCKQISGNVEDLTRAEIKEYRDDETGSNTMYFALMEGRKEHTLCHHLSIAETQWLVSEINEVLENIRQRTANPSESA